MCYSGIFLVQALHSLLSLFQLVKKDLDKKKPEIEELIKKSQGLLENNPDAKDGGSQQQQQRLRANTADLKMRFTAVSPMHPPFSSPGLILSRSMYNNVHF